MVIKLNREQKIYLLKALQAGEIVETELFSTIQALNTPIVQHISKKQQKGHSRQKMKLQQAKRPPALYH